MLENVDQIEAALCKSWVKCQLSNIPCLLQTLQVFEDNQKPSIIGVGFPVVVTPLDVKITLGLLLVLLFDHLFEMSLLASCV